MTGHGKRGKPTTGFPSFPTALGNRQKHDSHISTAPTTSALEKWKSKSRIPTFPPRLPFIQIKKENNSTRSAAPTFRLILRLEYTFIKSFFCACPSDHPVMLRTSAPSRRSLGSACTAPAICSAGEGAGCATMADAARVVSARKNLILMALSYIRIKPHRWAKAGKR